VKALELVERMRAGEPLRKLARRHGVVERQALNGWKRASPDFALRLEAAKLAGRAARARRLRPLPWPWDEALSDRMVLRVMRGERLIDVARGPDFPCLHVLRRWRRQHPDFDAALKNAIRRGRRAASRGRYTPEMAGQVCEAIAAGAALSDIRDDPRLPHDSTIRAWTRTRPDFAARLDGAREFRQWMIEDQIAGIAAAATPATVKAAERRIGRLRTRLRATAPKARRPADRGGQG
jgi:transposase-like protein